MADWRGAVLCPDCGHGRRVIRETNRENLATKVELLLDPSPCPHYTGDGPGDTPRPA